MAFNAARQSFSLSAVVSILLAVLFAARYAVAPYSFEEPFTGGMPVAAGITEFSAGWPRLSALLTILLVIWILVIVIQLTVRHASATSRNYLPIQFFIIAACGITVPAEALASFLAAWLLVLSTRQFISSFRKDMRFEEVFRAGLYLGFIPLLYAPGVLFLLLIPAAMSLYRRSARELTVSLAGALLPVPAAGFLYWAWGESPLFIYREIWRCVSERPGMLWPQHIPIAASVVAGLVVVMALVAVVWFLSHRKGMRTKQRKVMAHVSLMLLAALISTLIPGSSPAVVPLAAIPVAMAVPYSFSGRRMAIISSVLYCLLLIAVFALNLAPVLGVSIP